VPRYLILATHTPFIEQNLTILPYPAWQMLDILSGLSFLSPQTQAQFSPHELNIMQFKGLSLTKGCFIGQEVIARMHYLGKLKKHLWHITLHGQWHDGDLLYDKHVPCGQIVCSAQPFALAVLYEHALDTFHTRDQLAQGKKIALAHRNLE
jgi:folate-binding protein YgfZ